MRNPRWEHKLFTTIDTQKLPFEIFPFFSRYCFYKNLVPCFSAEFLQPDDVTIVTF